MPRNKPKSGPKAARRKKARKKSADDKSPFPLVCLEPDSDALHSTGAEEWWREAWYFEFYDPRSQVQFQAYQGVFPHKGTGDLTASIFHRGRRLEDVMKFDFTIPPDAPAERLCFGPLQLDLLEDFRRWRLRYDGAEVQADIEFEALHPPYSWAESKLWMESSSDPQQRSQHFDQFGRYTGRLWAAGKEIRIRALGFRDRMWGWGARKHWRNYVVLWSGFSPDFVANLSVQSFADGRSHLCGYLHRNGTRSLLRSARVEVDWDERRWKSVKVLRAEIEDLEGRRAKFSGSPMGIADTSHRWPHRHDHMLFSVGKYRCGSHTGHGVMNWAFATEADRPRVFEARLGGAG